MGQPKERRREETTRETRRQGVLARLVRRLSCRGCCTPGCFKSVSDERRTKKTCDQATQADMSCQTSKIGTQCETCTATASTQCETRVATASTQCGPVTSIASTQYETKTLSAGTQCAIQTLSAGTQCGTMTSVASTQCETETLPAGTQCAIQTSSAGTQCESLASSASIQYETRTSTNSIQCEDQHSATDKVELTCQTTTSVTQHQAQTATTGTQSGVKNTTIAVPSEAQTTRLSTQYDATRTDSGEQHWKTYSAISAPSDLGPAETGHLTMRSKEASAPSIQSGACKNNSIVVPDTSFASPDLSQTKSEYRSPIYPIAHPQEPSLLSTYALLQARVYMDSEIFRALQVTSTLTDVTSGMKDKIQDGYDTHEEDFSNKERSVESPNSLQNSYISFEERSISLPGIYILTRSVSAPGLFRAMRDPPHKYLFCAEMRGTRSLDQLNIGMYNYDTEEDLRKTSVERSSNLAAPGLSTLCDTKAAFKEVLLDIERRLGSVSPQGRDGIDVCRTGRNVVMDQHNLEETQEKMDGPREQRVDAKDRNGKMEKGILDASSDEDVAFDMEEAMLSMVNEDSTTLSSSQTIAHCSDILFDTKTFSDRREIPLSGTFQLIRSTSCPGFATMTRDPPNSHLFLSESRGFTRSLCKLLPEEYNFDPGKRCPFMEVNILSTGSGHTAHVNSTRGTNLITPGRFVINLASAIKQALREIDPVRQGNNSKGKLDELKIEKNLALGTTIHVQAAEEDPDIDKPEGQNTECDGRYDLVQNKHHLVLEAEPNTDIAMLIEDAMQDEPAVQHSNPDIASEMNDRQVILDMENAMLELWDVGQQNSKDALAAESRSTEPLTSMSPCTKKDIPLPGTFVLTCSISAPGFHQAVRDPPNANFFREEIRGETKSLHQLNMNEYNFDPDDEFIFQKNDYSRWRRVQNFRLKTERSDSFTSSFSIIEPRAVGFQSLVTESVSSGAEQLHPPITPTYSQNNPPTSTTSESQSDSDNWLIVSAGSIEPCCQPDTSSEIGNSENCHRTDIPTSQTLSRTFEGANNNYVGTRITGPSFYVDDCGYTTPSMDVPVLIDNDIIWELKPDGTHWVLGTGSFGFVEAAKLKTDDGTTVQVAVKRYHSEKDQAVFIREGKMQQYLADTGVFPEFYGYLDIGVGEHSTICLVSALFGKGTTLFDLLHDNAVILSHKEWFSICIQLAKGLRKIHGKDVLFNDVKSNNVLVDTSSPGTPLVKFIDLGLASLNGIQYNYSPDELRSFRHIAPEVKIHQSTSYLSDIWGLGVMFSDIAHRSSLPGLENVAAAAMTSDPAERISLDGITETLVLVARSQGLV